MHKTPGISAWRFWYTAVMKTIAAKMTVKTTQAKRAKEILRRLRKTYTQRGEFVEWSTPLELVVGTMLSAQCTDKRVNMVTKSLFAHYRTPQEYAAASLKQLEKEIGSVTFFRAKSRYLKGMGETLVREFNGVVPATRDELMQLPGIAFKSANLIMAKVHGKFTGVAVDTHVKRVAPRLGLTRHTQDTQKIAADLEKLYPAKEWLDVNEYFIMHGRALCKPAKPLCAQCPLQDICPTGRKAAKK